MSFLFTVFCSPALLKRKRLLISELGVSLASLITLSTPSFCPRSATTQRIIRRCLSEEISSSSSRSFSPDLATRMSTEPGFRRAAISLARHFPKPLDAPVMMQRALPKSFVSDEATFEVLPASMPPFPSEIIIIIIKTTKQKPRFHLLIILDARLSTLTGVGPMSFPLCATPPGAANQISNINTIERKRKHYKPVTELSHTL